MKKLVSVVLFFLLFSCMDIRDNRYIMFSNKHNETAYCFFTNKKLSLEEFLNEQYYLPDPVKKDSTWSLDRPRGGWEKYISESQDKKLKIYVIEKDSVDKYGWKEIFKKNICNKKYLLTIKDLDSLNWEIEYKGE
jgi:hypothetical protein